MRPIAHVVSANSTVGWNILFSVQCVNWTVNLTNQFTLPADFALTTEYFIHLSIQMFFKSQQMVGSVDLTEPAAAYAYQRAKKQHRHLFLGAVLQIALVSIVAVCFHPRRLVSKQPREIKCWNWFLFLVGNPFSLLFSSPLWPTISWQNLVFKIGFVTTWKVTPNLTVLST